MHRPAPYTVTRSFAFARLLGLSLFLPCSGIAATFEDWRAIHFNSTELADENISGPLADPEKDDRVNVMEYAMGSDPKAPDAGGTPFQINLGTSTQSLTFAEATGTEGLEWLFQSSGDLKHWITHNAVVEASRIPGSGLDTVTVDLPLPSGPPGKQFARIRLLHNETELLRAPNVVTPKALSGTSIQIEYSDTTPVETGFRIERRLPGATGWELVGSTASDVISFTDSDVSFTAGWEYRVIALGPGGTFVATEAFSVGNVTDTDGDGLPDSIELGSSYAGAPGTYPTDPNNPYSGDFGIPDGWFAANGFDPINHDLTSDTDGDGLSDGEEAVLGLNPNNEDTDGDTVIDSIDGWGGAEDPLFEALLAPSRLPSVRYAVIEIGEGVALRVNDVGQVLYADPSGYWFWDSGDSTELPASLPGYGGEIFFEEMNNNGEVLGSMLSTDWSSTGPNPTAGSTKAAIWRKDTGLSTLSIPYFLYGNSESFLDVRSINDGGVIVGQQFEAGYLPPVSEDTFPDWFYDGWGSVKIDGGTIMQDFKYGRSDGDVDISDGFTSSGRIFFPNVIRNDGSTAGAFREVHQGGSSANWGPLTAVVIDGNGTEHELDGLEEVFDLTDDRHALAWDNIWNTHLSVHKNNVYHNRSMPGQSINNRMEVVSGSTIWRNFRTFELGDLFDSQGILNLNAVDINNSGAILAEADGQVVLLMPAEWVTETEKGSGQYQTLTNLPIFSPNDGVGRGTSTSINYDLFSIGLTENLDSSVINVMDVTYQSSAGNFTGTLTETTASSGVFQDAGGTFIMTLNPPITTSDTTQDTLHVLVTASALGLSNSPMALLETTADTKEFVKPQMDVELILTAALNSAQPDTVNLRLQGEGSYDLVLTETGNDTHEFKTADDQLTMTLSNYSGLNPGTVDTLDIAYSTGGLPVPVTYQLTERDASSNVFANFTINQGNRPVADPVESHDGVFYLKLSGFAGQTVDVKLKSGANELTVQATAPPGVTDYVMTPPLMLAQTGSSPSYSGINVLRLAAGASDIQTLLMSATSPALTSTVRFPAFLGAALNVRDYRALPSGHFDTLDHIIGRKTTSWFFWSTPPKLGYSPSTVDEGVSIGSLQDALPYHSIFYIVAHGKARATVDEQDVDFHGFVVWNGWTPFASLTHLVTAAEIESSIGDNEYNLVFPNSCGGANDSLGVATDYANAFRAKNYVSWQFPVLLNDAAQAAEQFFDKLDGGNTVRSAANNIRATQYIGFTLGGLGNRIPLTVVRRDNSVIIDSTP